MSLYIPDFNKIRKAWFFVMALVLLNTGCMQNGDSPPSTTSLDQRTPRADIQTVPTRTSGPNDVQPQSEAERIAQEFIDSGGQFTASPASCTDILKVEPWCGVIKSAARISKPEWEELFPTTDFYVVRRVLYGGELPFQRNLLVVEQDETRYSVGAYQRLLDTNIIEISEENHELVARSIVLMMLPDFIEYRVKFIAWEEGDWPSRLRLNFNYRLTIWTELGGYEMRWLFLFYEGELLAAVGWVAGEGIGEFTPVPREGPRPPPQVDLEYWKR